MRRRLLPAAVLLAAATTVSGCFDEPKIEDRWTRIDIQGANVAQSQAMPAGSSESLFVSTNVTYRSIITGYAVADLRVSSGPGSANVAPDAPREAMASAIDGLLASSTSVGRRTRAITGWDHLIQHLDFGFRAAIPDTLPPGGGLFLLVYLGSGDKIERLGQPDTIIVTPYRSGDYQILPIGMTFQAAP
jgi:hypothetical protein